MSSIHPANDLMLQSKSDIEKDCDFVSNKEKLKVTRLGVESSTRIEQFGQSARMSVKIADLSIFTYYTFWVIILPFVDSDHFIHNYFLPKEFALIIPVFAGVALLSLLSMFIGFVILI
ncbi:hypothetical protein AAC387_Pa06g2338 [Persea americana]